MDTLGLEVIAPLIGMLGLLFLVWWGVRQWVARAYHEGGAYRVRLLQRIPLGGRREILVLKVADRILIVGVTDHHFTVLDQQGGDRHSPSIESSVQERRFPMAEKDYSLKAFFRSLRFPS